MFVETKIATTVIDYIFYKLNLRHSNCLGSPMHKTLINKRQNRALAIKQTSTNLSNFKIASSNKVVEIIARDHQIFVSSCCISLHAFVVFFLHKKWLVVAFAFAASSSHMTSHKSNVRKMRITIKHLVVGNVFFVGIM